MCILLDHTTQSLYDFLQFPPSAPPTNRDTSCPAPPLPSSPPSIPRAPTGSLHSQAWRASLQQDPWRCRKAVRFVRSALGD